jgi:HPt (histidine-containing phosphotransfer) domain-containing protein
MAHQFHHIDPRSLLDAIGNDRATFVHLIGMFLRSTPPARDALAAALAGDDRDTARRLAHELRGNVVIFGATDLAANLAHLEKSLDDGPAPPALAVHCNGLIDAVLAEMALALGEDGTPHPF